MIKICRLLKKCKKKNSRKKNIYGKKSSKSIDIDASKICAFNHLPIYTKKKYIRRLTLVAYHELTFFVLL